MKYQPDSAVADWTPRILGTLEAASKEMAFADVPVGSFLSGGIDSSSVTAALSKAGCSVSTFTVGFEDEGYDERPWAREVARLYRTVHSERVVVAEDIVPVFQRLLWHYDEPFNDYSYLPTYYLCREARQANTVALSGDGGDELFAGYPKYRLLSARQSVDRLVPRALTRLLCGEVSAAIPHRRLRSKFLSYGVDADALMLDMLTKGFPVRALRGSARGSLAEALKHYSPLDTIQELLRRAPPEQVGVINAMRYLDLKLTLAGDILVKVDRASMAVALEVRPVYLHRDMLALAGEIPAGLLVDRQQTKRLLKASFRSWLPDSILYRPKMGFALPLHNWLGDLGSLFTPRHGDELLDELLDVPLSEELARAHSVPGANIMSVIHSHVLLRHWLNQWHGKLPVQRSEYAAV
jgi:asparagine synthase (glutamine-hydrolysing)